MAQVIKNPKLLNDIAHETKQHAAARKAAEAERAELAKERQQLDEARRKFAAEQDHEIRNHQAAMAAAQAELAAVKRQAADLKSKAEQDAARAKELRATVERKQRAFDAA